MFDLRAMLRRLLPAREARMQHGVGKLGEHEAGAPKGGLEAVGAVIQSLPVATVRNSPPQEWFDDLAPTIDDQAVAASDKAAALGIDPTDLRGLIEQGTVLRGGGDPAGAVSLWMRAVELAPDTPGLRYNLACALAEAGDTRAAISQARTARATDGNPLPAALLLGQLFELGEHFELAAQAYDDAISLAPTAQTGWAGLGRVRRNLAEFALAEVAFLKAGEKFEIDVALARLNQHRPADAIAVCAQLISRQPQRADAGLVLANAHLSNGDFEAGWRAYEARFQVPGTVWPEVSAPQWSGKRLDGTLLVDCEQGFGDCFFAVRFLADARKRVRHLILRCPASLAGIFSASGVADEIVAPHATVVVHAHAFLLSLPGLLGVDSAHALEGYLKAGAASRAKWKRRLDGSGIAIGLVWSGLAKAPQNRYRRFDPAPLVPLLGGMGRLFSLQLPATGVESCPTGVVDLAPELVDFGETAAAMHELDLVVTAETAVAHLAGALGVRAWIPLPLTSDWRWQIAGRENPWYSSTQVFRQSKPMRWDDVFDAIRANANQLANAGRLTPSGLDRSRDVG